jgi:hypothetical protein
MTYGLAYNGSEHMPEFQEEVYFLIASGKGFVCMSDCFV